MYETMKDINADIARDIARVKVDNLEVADKASIIEAVRDSVRSQIKDIDDAEEVIAEILWDEYNIEE